MDLLYSFLRFDHQPDAETESVRERFDFGEGVHFIDRRVILARALSYDPDIILANEPTGNLDSDTQNEIMEIFRKMTDQGKCVILVSHSPEVAALCDVRYELTKISGKNKRKTNPA